MTSRERVRRALEFDNPDRIPRQTWVLPIAGLEHGWTAIGALQEQWPEDTTTCDGAASKSGATKGSPYAVGFYTDEWGCTFENVQKGVMGMVKLPILSHWDRLSDLELPEWLLNVNVEAANASCAVTRRWTIAPCCPRVFERMQFLRGSQALFIDLAEESSELRELRDRVFDFYRREWEIWAETDVDMLMLMDDWGAQRGLLIDPALWRTWFRPLYAELVAIAHAKGKKVLYHSDGYIDSILGDFVDMGVDAINCQLFCMDIEDIGRRYRGKITFWGEIDRQHLLAFGTADEIHRAVRQVYNNLAMPSGGVIAQFEIGPGASLPNVWAVREAWDLISSPSSAKIPVTD